MSLLAPWFLLGGLLVGLPLWLHRLQTQSADRRPFSSSMLLDDAEQQIHVRQQLKYRVLLALRIALLLLAALAFAKPLWTTTPSQMPSADAGTHLVLVDTSASMNRVGVFSHAQALATSVIDDAPAGALVQVLSAGGSVQVQSAPAADRAAHRAAVANLAPTSARTDFGRVMADLDRHADSLPRPVTLHFVSDFQQSALPARFADLVSTRVARLVAHPAGRGPSTNWAVEAIRESPEGINVMISGEGETQPTVRLTLNGESVGTRTRDEDGAVHFDTPVYEDGDNRIIASVEGGDDLAADDTRYAIVDNRPPAPVPVLTADPDGLPATYLAAALQSDRTPGYRVERLVVGEFDARVLSRYRWIVIDDLGSINEALEPAIREYLESGGNVLAFAGVRTDALRRLPVSGHDVRAVSDARSGNGFIAVGSVDTGHPVLSATEGWHLVNVSQVLPLTLNEADETLVRLENGDALLVERRIGEGRLLLFNGDLERRHNDLPVRPVFVAYIVEAARYLSGRAALLRNFVAGDVLALVQDGAVSGQVIGPDGDALLSLADTASAQQVRLNQPGFYQVYTQEGSYTVAVNTDPRESSPRTIADETLGRWQAAMEGEAVPGTAATIDDGESAIELWHVLLAVLALVFVGESMLGDFYLDRRTVH
jgi:hypothetical protein